MVLSHNYVVVRSRYILIKHFLNFSYDFLKFQWILTIQITLSIECQLHLMYLNKQETRVGWLEIKVLLQSKLESYISNPMFNVLAVISSSTQRAITRVIGFQHRHSLQWASGSHFPRAVAQSGLLYVAGTELYIIP